MPFKASDRDTGEVFLSIDPAIDWDGLRAQAKGGRHLRMTCCDAPAVLKKSKLGLRFFAHKKGGECATAPETIEHLRLKEIAVRAIREAGWEVDVEVSGSTPSGEAWRADVLAWKGKAKVAVEIQWSPQSNEELVARQARYEEAGIRGLWLLRHPGFPISKEIPAAVVVKVGDAFYACIPDRSHVSKDQKGDPWHQGWHQSMGVEEFFEAAFARRFFWAPRENQPGRISLTAYTSDCSRCHRPTVKIESVDLFVDGLELSAGLEQFEKDERLFHDTFSPQLLRSLGAGPVQMRYSKTRGSSNFSNGCFHCNVLQGGVADWLSRDHWDEPSEEIASSSIAFEGRWLEIFGRGGKHWNVEGAGALDPALRPQTGALRKPKASQDKEQERPGPQTDEISLPRSNRPPYGPGSITMEEIRAALEKRGRGLDRELLVEWGVPWPPDRGWEERLVELGLPDPRE